MACYFLASVRHGRFWIYWSVFLFLKHIRIHPRQTCREDSSRESKSYLPSSKSLSCHCAFTLISQLALYSSNCWTLAWNQYSLLTPIRYVLNPRFHLTTPLQSGLLYIAPGGGYSIGTFLGGRWADYIVRRWIHKRGGVHVPEDWLKSCLPFMIMVIPACILIYGWMVEKSLGGISVPVAVMVSRVSRSYFPYPV